MQDIPNQPAELPPPPQEADVSPEEQKQQRQVMLVLIGLLVVFIVFTIASVYFLLLPTTDTEKIRDVFIIFLALLSMVMMLILVVLIYQLSVLINLLQNEIKPIISSTNETVSTLRGTANFLSENLTEPVIKLNEYVAGFSQFFTLFRTTPKRGKAPKKSNNQGE